MILIPCAACGRHVRVGERGCPFCGVARILAATGVSLAMMAGCQKDPVATIDDAAAPVVDSGVATKAAPLVADTSESADSAAATDSAADADVRTEPAPLPDAAAKPPYVPRPPAPVYGGPPPPHPVPRPKPLYGGPPKPPSNPD